VLSSLFEAALRSLMLAIIVWAGLRVFRVHNVIYQRLAWTAVLLGALLMPFLLPFTARWASFSFVTIPAAAPLHRLRAALSPAESAPSFAAKSSTVFTQPAPPYRFPGLPIASTPVAHIDAVPADLHSSASAFHKAPPAHASRPRPSLLGLIALAYFLVATALLARLLLGWISAMRLWRSATPIAPGGTALIHSHLNLRTSRKVSSPVTIGSGIVLPAGYTSWTEEKLRIVLAHERTHVIQRDFHLLTLASLYAAVTWFSPLGWWLKRKLSDLGEAISDRSGLDAASNRSAYAQILLEFAAAPRPTSIGVAMARPSNISRRIERLLNDSYLRHAFSSSARARVAVLLVPVVLFACAALVRVQAATQPAQAPSAPGVTAAKLPSPPAVPQPPVPAGTSVAAVVTAPPAPPSDFEMTPPPPAAQTVAAIAPLPPPEAFLAGSPVPPLPPAAGEGDSEKFKGEFDRNLSISGKVDLSLSTGSGTIVLKQGSSNQVHVHGVVRVYRDGEVARGQQLVANPPIEQNGNSIRIGVEHENLRNISIDYVVEAPADAALNAATGSGDINDTGVGQGARLTTGSGTITATGLEGGFRLQTGSGDIRVDGTGQGDVKVQTGSGGIDVKGVHGSLDAQTGSGDMKIEGTPSAAWKLMTGSGSVDLATGNAGMNLNAATGSGEISTNHPAEMRTEEQHHHIHLQLNGGGTDVRVVTGSGDIKVR
jgi:hypothetical protein